MLQRQSGSTLTYGPSSGRKQTQLKSKLHQRQLPSLPSVKTQTFLSDCLSNITSVCAFTPEVRDPVSLLFYLHNSRAPPSTRPPPALFTRFAEAKQVFGPITAAHGGVRGPVPGRHVREERRHLAPAVRKRSTRWRCDVTLLQKSTPNDGTNLFPWPALEQVLRFCYFL